MRRRRGEDSPAVAADKQRRTAADQYDALRAALVRELNASSRTFLYASGAAPCFISSSTWLVSVRTSNWLRMNARSSSACWRAASQVM